MKLPRTSASAAIARLATRTSGQDFRSMTPAWVAHRNTAYSTNGVRNKMISVATGRIIGQSPLRVRLFMDHRVKPGDDKSLSANHRSITSRRHCRAAPKARDPAIHDAPPRSAGLHGSHRYLGYLGSPE